MQNLRVTEILQDFVSFFFPRYCPACEEALMKGEEIICTRCLLAIPKTEYHHLPYNALHQKLEGRLRIKYAFPFLKFKKRGRVQQVLHALKYKNHPEVGIALGKIYGRQLCDAGYQDAFDLIIPVPLHISRRRKRGYNQSAEFGRGLSEALNKPCSDTVMQRLVKTETQTRKSKVSRWENVKDIFHVAYPEAVVNKRILLVDDVITTGATIEACGERLLQAGCREVSVAAIAMA